MRFQRHFQNRIKGKGRWQERGLPVSNGLIMIIILMMVIGFFMVGLANDSCLINANHF